VTPNRYKTSGFQITSTYTLSGHFTQCLSIPGAVPTDLCITLRAVEHDVNRLQRERLIVDNEIHTIGLTDNVSASFAVVIFQRYQMWQVSVCVVHFL
jgi:hypothetical protein